MKQLKSIRFVTIDNGYYDQFLGTCGLDVDVFPSQPPAKLYNSILDETEGYVGIIHSDVTCNGLVESIEETISTHGFHGAIGVVGAGSVWGRVNKYHFSPTCDSCFILVDADSSVRFDDKTFDGYHLFVEDYCVQVGGAGIMMINGYEGGVHDDPRYFAHHSQTLRKMGCAWGDYGEYKKRLFKKWGRLIRTT